MCHPILAKIFMLMLVTKEIGYIRKLSKKKKKTLLIT